MDDSPQFLPSRDPPPAVDPENSGVTVVPTGRAAPAAPSTSWTVADGGGRLAYDPARLGLQEGQRGPARCRSHPGRDVDQ